MNDQCSHKMSIRDDSSPARCTRCGVTYADMTAARGDRVESVGQTAIRPGYVVLRPLRGTPGGSGRVYRRAGDDLGGVVQASQEEQAGVAQLVEDGVLTVGRSTTVNVDGRSRRALLVVMPDHIRPIFEKWCCGRHRRPAPDPATPDAPAPVAWRDVPGAGTGPGETG